MAGETRPPGRSRPASGTPNDTPDLTATDTDPALAPITANTPLPPVTPLPLASQSGGGSAAPQPPPGPAAPPSDLPPLPPDAYPPPPAFAEAAPMRAADSGVTSGWAARTTFILMLTSAVLLAAMAIAYTAATKKDGPLVFVVIMIVAVNIVYPLIVFRIARPGPAQPMRLPFMNPRRGP
jgi:hypothetical protein